MSVGVNLFRVNSVRQFFPFKLDYLISPIQRTLNSQDSTTDTLEPIIDLSDTGNKEVDIFTV